MTSLFTGFFSFSLGRSEGDYCDLGWAVEAEGKAYGADAAVDVELHAVEGVVSFWIFEAHGRKDERADKGETHLASVGVAGEHEIDQMSLGMGGDGIGKIGFVDHQDDGAVGVARDGEAEVGMAGAGIIYSCEPEAGVAAFDRKMGIDQERGAVIGKGFGDQGRIEGDVMVSEAAVAEGGGQCAEDLGAAMNGVVAGDECDRAVGDEVPGEEDEIGVEVVDLFNDTLEEERLGELVEVDVADLDDAVAVEWGGQVGDGDGALDDVDLMARYFAGVECQAGCGGPGGDEKVSACESRRPIGRNAGHTS